MFVEVRKDCYRLLGDRSSKCFEKSEEREEAARLGGESFTWSVFEKN